MKLISLDLSVNIRRPSFVFRAVMENNVFVLHYLFISSKDNRHSRIDFNAMYTLYNTVGYFAILYVLNGYFDGVDIRLYNATIIR